MMMMPMRGRREEGIRLYCGTPRVVARARLVVLLVALALSSLPVMVVWVGIA